MDMQSRIRQLFLDSIETKRQLLGGQPQQAFADLLPGDWLQRWQTEPARAFMELDRQVAERLQQLDEEYRERQTVLDKEHHEQSHRQQALQACSTRLGELEQLRQTAAASLRQCLGE